MCDVPNKVSRSDKEAIEQLCPWVEKGKAWAQNMRKMSLSLLLRERLSSGTLEEGEEWTQEEDVQQKSKIKIA